MKTLLETPDFSVVHDAPNQWLYLTWRGAHSPASTRHRCDQILAYARQTGSPLLLNDSSQDLDGWGGLTDWIALDFLEELAASGVRAVAWVLPANLRARTDSEIVLLRRHLAGLDQPLVDTFGDLEAAHTWLQHQARSAPPR